ncbi:MAG: pyridoxal-phosphate dependent enzyme [Pseudomonadota bacterium]
MNLISEDEFLQRAKDVPMQVLQWDIAKRKDVEVIVRRDDLVDRSLSGNKFYKLFYSLQRAKKNGHQKVLSFGGAYSNHLYALAAAGRDFGFKTVGVIRGERPKYLSPMLQDVEKWGMQLHFVSRTDYCQLTRQAVTGMQPGLKNSGLENSAQGNLEREYLEHGTSEYGNLVRTHGDFYSIPEGGANSEGLRGAAVIGWAIEQQRKGDYAAICLACGTGNTVAGVAAGVATAVTLGENSVEAAKVIGFSVLKGEGDLGQQIITQQQNAGLKSNNWRLISGYHAGGYAKKLPGAVQEFQQEFERETNLLLDPVYTLKMCWGVAQLLRLNYWPRGSRLILIHTGGLQGRRGFNRDIKEVSQISSQI